MKTVPFYTTWYNSVYPWLMFWHKVCSSTTSPYFQVFKTVFKKSFIQFFMVIFGRRFALSDTAQHLQKKMSVLASLEHNATLLHYQIQFFLNSRKKRSYHFLSFNTALFHFLKSLIQGQYLWIGASLCLPYHLRSLSMFWSNFACNKNWHLSLLLLLLFVWLCELVHVYDD